MSITKNDPLIIVFIVQESPEILLWNLDGFNRRHYIIVGLYGPRLHGVSRSVDTSPLNWTG